jgi:lysophospholipase L1-like esterase
LPRFGAALRELALGHRTDPVRVLWLGDSHAAADFWPDAVRKPLQERFGVGGPGFLYLGLGVYRHGGVKVERDGKWRAQPKQPSLWMPQDDGVFGLGGIRVVPLGDESRVRLTLAKDGVRGGARWDLAYRLPTAKARFRIDIEGGDSRLVDANAAKVASAESKDTGAPTILHIEWQTPGGATVSIGHAAGDPEILGLTVESHEPGVVVDTLGINGARIGTPLAWSEPQWVAEAERRHAALFVLAYGTNEIGDQVAPYRYGPELEALVNRVRKAAPDADCLVVGPTDRAGPEWSSLPRVAEIDEVERQTAERVGCVYFSTVDAMGGEGSLKRWADQSPPLAGSDRVHLTPRGYAELGNVMTQSAFADVLRRD